MFYHIVEQIIYLFIPKFQSVLKSFLLTIPLFNYTTFLSKVLPHENYLYFHGSLNNYLRIDHRDLLNIDNANNVISFLESTIKPNIDFDKGKYVIPGIIPPLKLKPVLSYKFIEAWYKASRWISDANKIIVFGFGYSFNHADEHFNDIIRTNREKPIYIVNPSAEDLKKKLSKIFGFREEDFTETFFQGKRSYQCHNIHIIEAKAHEIDLSKGF